MTNATDNRTTELLPCPFCGGEADVMLTQGRYGQSYSIHHESHGNCAAKYVNTVNFHTEAEAIEAWNTRAGRGECENIAPSYLDFLCSSCGFVHYHSDENDSGDGNEWNFCPSCGKAVKR